MYVEMFHNMCKLMFDFNFSTLLRFVNVKGVKSVKCSSVVVVTL